ncbi:MAG: hypothetical protein ABF743_12025 [Schleiferilactobacillus perolens]|jgi:predicted RNase H-like HicB family nuclease|uniref:hypothetical protein n=1 Tax=Schleiferilactobacillus perolens TaxID=100468 RepID=UPI0039EB8F49
MGEKKKHQAWWPVTIAAAALLGGAVGTVAFTPPVQAATTLTQTSNQWENDRSIVLSSALFQNSVIPMTWNTPVLVEVDGNWVDSAQQNLQSLITAAHDAASFQQAWAQIGQQAAYRLALTVTHSNNTTTVQNFLQSASSDPQYHTLTNQQVFQQLFSSNNFSDIIQHVADYDNQAVVAPVLKVLQQLGKKQQWERFGQIERTSNGQYAVTVTPVSDLVASASSSADLNQHIQSILGQLTERTALMLPASLLPQTLSSDSASQIASFLTKRDSNGATIQSVLDRLKQAMTFTVGQPLPDYAQLFSFFANYLNLNKSMQGTGSETTSSTDQTQNNDNQTSHTNRPPAPNIVNHGNAAGIRSGEISHSNQTLKVVDTPASDRNKVIILSERITSIQYSADDSHDPVEGVLPQTSERKSDSELLQVIGVLLMSFATSQIIFNRKPSMNH